MDGPFSSATKLFSSSDLNRIVQSPDFALLLEDEVPVKSGLPKPSLLTSLVAGAAAGVVVDISLYPLDTIKTRLQSENGFRASGGFRGVYKGIGAVLIGSAPTSAIFFGSYNGMVNYLKKKDSLSDPWIHFLSASVSEIIAATIRVPLELLKQRRQTSTGNRRLTDILKQTVHAEGLTGLYRGFSFFTTIAREIPFTAIQFLLWENFKKQLTIFQGRHLTTFEAAFCGAAAGGISAALTTPMDVIKTRTMLASTQTLKKYGRLISYFITVDVIRERGIRGLFAGFIPRVTWITLGGFIYFGIYESMKTAFENQSFIPVERSEMTIVFDNKEMKNLEKEKFLMGRSAPSYLDEDEINVLDFTDKYDNFEEEIDLIFRELAEFITSYSS